MSPRIYMIHLTYLNTIILPGDKLTQGKYKQEWCLIINISCGYHFCYKSSHFYRFKLLFIGKNLKTAYVSVLRNWTKFLLFIFSHVVTVYLICYTQDIAQN